MEGNGDTLLHKAAEEGREEMIRFLAGQGVKLNARGSCGYTPLHLAAMRIKVEPVAELLRLGADRNVKDDEGSTPLDVVIDENGEIARLLRGGGGGKG